MDDKLRSELRAALDEVYRPAPALVADARAAIRRPGSRRGVPRLVVALAVALTVALVAGLVWSRLERGLVPAPANPTVPPVASAPRAAPLPPIPAVPQTGPGAQVAWMDLTRSSGPSPDHLFGVDAHGHVVAQVALDSGPYLNGFIPHRTPDGSRLVTENASTKLITVFDARTGHTLHKIPYVGGNIYAEAFTADGHYLFLLVPTLNGNELTGHATNVVDMLDLGSGRLVATIRLPDGTGVPGWFAVGPDGLLYALTGTGGAATATVLAFDAGGMKVSRQAHADGSHGFPAVCPPGPLATAWIDRFTMAAYCEYGTDAAGTISFFDTRQLTVTGTLHATVPPRSSVVPAYSPDGRRLYLHDVSSHQVQVVDLLKRTIAAPATPAGLPASTNTGAAPGAISPDGRRLYVAWGGGVSAVSLPGLKATTIWTGGNAQAVWVSGDGRTLYVLGETGTRLHVLDDSGHQLGATVALPDRGYDFLASTAS